MINEIALMGYFGFNVRLRSWCICIWLLGLQLSLVVLICLFCVYVIHLVLCGFAVCFGFGFGCCFGIDLLVSS